MCNYSQQPIAHHWGLSIPLPTFMYVHAVTQEESDPTHLSAHSQSSDHSAKDPSKHAIVSGSDERRLANRTPMGPNQQNKPLQLEPDSGVPNDPGTPDTCPKQICVQQQFEMPEPRSPPPGSLRFQVPVPPILKNGASVNYIPHNDHGLGTENGVVESEGSEGQDGDTDGQVPMIPKGNGKRSTTTTNNETSTSAGETEALVPTSGGRINSIAHQPIGMRKLDVVEHSSSENDCDTNAPSFTIGSEQEAEETEDQEEEEATFSNPPMPEVSKQSKSKEELATQKRIDCLQSASNAIINELEGLTEKNEKLEEKNEELEAKIKNLERQLSVENDEKQSLKQENDERNNRFVKYQENAQKKEEASKTELQGKKRELEECRSKIAEMQKEKEVIESNCEERCKKLQTEIENLEKAIEEEKKTNKLQTMELRVELADTKTELKDKDLTIAKIEKQLAEQKTKHAEQKAQIAEQKVQIVELEKQKLEESNKKLKKENEELKERDRSRQESDSLSHGMSSMDINASDKSGSDNA